MQVLGIKKPLRGVSAELAKTAEMLNSFELAEDHPLKRHTISAIAAYWRLAHAIGEMDKAVKQIDNELVNADEN